MTKLAASLVIFFGLCFSTVGALAGDEINLNTASSFKLMKIDYVSRSLARAIVNHRDTHGPFKHPRDLLKVRGLTPELFKRINPERDAQGNLVSRSLARSDGNNSMAIPNY
jgi:competence ComEA-like helix-hairpin-helix protein